MYNSLGTRYSYALEIYSGKYGYKRNEIPTTTTTPTAFLSSKPDTVTRTATSPTVASSSISSTPIPSSLLSYDPPSRLPSLRSHSIRHAFDHIPNDDILDIDDLDASCFLTQPHHIASHMKRTTTELAEIERTIQTREHVQQHEMERNPSSSNSPSPTVLSHTAPMTSSTSTVHAGVPSGTSTLSTSSSGADYTSDRASASPFPSPSSAESYRCLRMFNPLSMEVYEATLQHWAHAYLSIIHETIAIRAKGNNLTPHA